MVATATPLGQVAFSLRGLLPEFEEQSLTRDSRRQTRRFADQPSVIVYGGLREKAPSRARKPPSRAKKRRPGDGTNRAGVTKEKSSFYIHSGLIRLGMPQRRIGSSRWDLEQVVAVAARLTESVASLSLPTPVSDADRQEGWEVRRHPRRPRLRLSTARAKSHLTSDDRSGGGNMQQLGASLAGRILRKPHRHETVAGPENTKTKKIPQDEGARSVSSVYFGVFILKVIGLSPLTGRIRRAPNFKGGLPSRGP